MNRNASLLVAGMLFLLSTSARAAGPADNANPVEKARASFHQGVQLYNEGSFEAALAEFRKAYQLNPNYRLLYNIAQTYFDLHDYVSSLKTLKQYVQEGGSEISPDRRVQVRELNQKLEERIAYLDVACNLDGADIRVDDISVGGCPLPSPVPVNAGPRRITAVKPGYAVMARVITVVGMEKAKVVFDFSAPARGGVVLDLQGEPAPKEPPRIGLITSTVVAGGFAVATGIFGILALDAKRDFNDELARFPNTKDNIDSARDKMKNYAYLTDAFGAATLVSGGVALYFLFTENASKKHSSTKTSVALAPTVGGMVLQGEW